MLQRLFLSVFLLIGCCWTVFAQKTVYSFLEPTALTNAVSKGVSIKPVELNQQQVSLRRLNFQSGVDVPTLTIPLSLNLTEKDALSIHVQNAMDWDLTLNVTVRDANNAILKAVVSLPAGPVQALLIPLHAFSSRTWGMTQGVTAWQDSERNYLLPVFVSGSIDASKIRSISLSMDRPAADQSLLVGEVDKVDKDVERMAYWHIVDKYGQYTRTTWPQKILSNKQLKRMSASEATQLSRWLKDARWTDIYGGVGEKPQFSASHYFRTEKHNGRWYFVSPNGYTFVSLGVNAVTPHHSQTYIAGRDFMFVGLPDNKSTQASFYGYANTHSGNAAQGGRGVDVGKWFDFYKANLYRTYGQNFLVKWRDDVMNRLKAWGFNTIGNWSDDDLVNQHRLPYTSSIYIRGDYNTVSSGLDWWGYMPDTFDPKFKEAVDKAVQAVEDKKDDPWLIGYFADNELSWGKLGSSPAEHYALVMNVLAQPLSSPAKQAFLMQLKAKYTEVGLLAKAWGVSDLTWSKISSSGFKAPIPDIKHPAIEQDYSLFLRRYADHYFKTVKEALAKRDPNHLFLGNRFAVKLPEVIKSCAKYCDVISFNTYTALASQGYDKELIAQLDRPIMITEFSFGSKSMGYFWGGPMTVVNEEARGNSYQQFVQKAFDDPHMVGVHWFEYVDEPLTGRLLDGENAHIGLVSITDKPVQPLIKKVRETNFDILQHLLSQ